MGNVPNFNLPNLKSLFLNGNKLTGPIPNFSNLPVLVDLGLAGNQLTGSIPSFNFPNLQSLNLAANNLSGCLPLGLKSLCGKNVILNQNPLLATQDFAAFGNPTERPGGIAGNKCVRKHICRHNSTCADHRIIANTVSADDRCVGADRGTAADYCDFEFVFA